MTEKSILDKTDIHNLTTFKLQTYYAILWLEQKKKGVKRTALEIAKLLIGHFKIPASRKLVYDSLFKNKDVHNGSDGYKLMMSGIKQLTPKNNTGIVLIKANEPFAAKSISIKDTFYNMDGDIKICDPYFDTLTLDFIYRNFSKKGKISFLTSKTKDLPKGSLKSQINEILKEGYSIEVRVYSGSELHDRYIMNKSSFWLSGNSLNGLGNKESFLIELGEDIKESMTATFNNRWKSSICI